MKFLHETPGRRDGVRRSIGTWSLLFFKRMLQEVLFITNWTIVDGYL